MRGFFVLTYDASVSSLIRQDRLGTNIHGPATSRDMVWMEHRLTNECVVLCFAVSCRVVSCRVVLCCAVLCCAVLCCAVLCCAVLCCAVLCCAVL
eukprot:COSAG06_NODE_1044_length_10979_cov_10.105331_1_plen_94_part_10